ncbi:Co2+/Mg2+ efflux protein ApaG [Aestuariibacter sp. AA17]|uniref:Co2+/Mg2+ efflux protein ApaG n=1 Tax=Fluctibacter corallii TaxID=2984329 RepID=A0ABT3A4I0_9ALTE|nr:Co2+/Mg2+ efflux protein ApaG [Aestuariibacter sp. AA17]MCV2883568.1 Co2+/Mg2+ efflux protein ApaG [Aestuariibacter sp. AA17]
MQEREREKLQQNVGIEVSTQFVEKDDLEKDKHAFAYEITIRNENSIPVQLLNRYWLITDGNGKQTQVQGPGVVGKQPVIESGKSFTYSSGAILDTPIGTMEGFYEMTAGEEVTFKVSIPVFRLAVPNLVN